MNRCKRASQGDREGPVTRRMPSDSGSKKKIKTGNGEKSKPRANMAARFIK